MPSAPSCLHIPALYEEGAARISWESVEGAVRYELDCVFDGTFEQAKTGRSWTALEAARQSWAEIEGIAYTWEDLEGLPALGLAWQNLEFENLSWEEWEARQDSWDTLERLPALFTIYSGEGAFLRAPDQGLTWNQMDSKGLIWEEIEEKRFTWLSFERLASCGLPWSQLEERALDWSQIEQRGLTWRQMEEWETCGLCWESLDSHWLAWEEIESKIRSWTELEGLPADCRDHRSCLSEIPLYKKSASYRVRALGETGYSPYLTSPLLPVAPRSLANYRPPCLHVPALYEEKSVKLVWGELYAASGYILERQTNGGAFVKIYEGPGLPAPRPGDCKEWEKLWYQPDCKRYFSYTDTVPLYAKTAAYRIRGYNTTDYSQYLVTETLPVTPSFRRDSSAEWQVEAGRFYRLAIYGREVRGISHIQLMLTYPSSLLELTDFTAQLPEPHVKPGGIPEAWLWIDAAEAGRIRFRFTKAIAEGKRWSGCMTLVEWRAKAAGTVRVTLS